MKRIAIDFKMALLDGVIGRCGSIYATSSLRPCQKHHLRAYEKASEFLICLILLLAIGFAVPAPAAEPPPPALPNTAPAPGQVAPSTPSTPDTPAPMTDIHDIRPPVPVGLDMPPWLVPVLLGLAGVVLLAALFFWWRRHRKKRTIETIVPELPPEMVAMHALDGIGGVRGQDGRAFYFRLSAVLRQYIFGRFGVGAPEMTTEEFLPCIERLPVDRDLARQLKQLCRAMDPVKFAGEKTVEKQMETDLFFARAFVRQTAPEATPETPPDTNAQNAQPTALPPAEGKG